MAGQGRLNTLRPDAIEVTDLRASGKPVAALLHDRTEGRKLTPWPRPMKSQSCVLNWRVSNL
jgi:hypothetical protein